MCKNKLPRPWSALVRILTRSATTAMEEIAALLPATQLCKKMSRLSLSVTDWAQVCLVYVQTLNPQVDSFSMSAVAVALSISRPAALTFLLDEVHTWRPITLHQDEVLGLRIVAANSGTAAMPIFKELENRGFCFKDMIVPFPHSQITDAERLLASARKSGDAAFLRYLVKNLGLVATTGHLEHIAETSAFVGDLPPGRADLEKYECSSCDAVGTTKFCTGCKVSRYCSTECQRMHWKEGGHNQECRKIQRHEKKATEERVSGAAGSSRV